MVLKEPLTHLHREQFGSEADKTNHKFKRS